ncbi:unnamed protein product [Rotaria sp. Silwood1]|nr:unnamed protein product [Rotaria sp. Silwood1]
MNRSSSIPINSIAQNCRLILRERYRIQQACNCTNCGFANFPQQENSSYKCKTCHTISTNPICSPCGINNVQGPIVCCEEPSYCNNLVGISPTISSNDYVCQSSYVDRNRAPMQPILNKQTGHVEYLSISSEYCIQMITDAIITKIRYKVPEEEIAILCCCLPSLIRQIMCKSPWLTPNDIIQWLCSDIITAVTYPGFFSMLNLDF